MSGNEHVLALSRLKLRELAKPLLDILAKCKSNGDWIYGVLRREYDESSSLGMYSWGCDSPDVAIAKLMADADRMIQAIDYLVSLSFVDWLSPDRSAEC